MAQRHASRIRGDVDVEVGVRGQIKRDVSRARTNAPHILGQAFAVNVAAARLSSKSSINAVYRDVARSGVDVPVALARLVDFNVAAARSDLRRSSQLPPLNISRPRLETHFPGKSRQSQVARSALQIDGALQPFHLLIAAAGVRANRGVLGDSDLVVDRNVVEVHV